MRTISSAASLTYCGSPSFGGAGADKSLSSREPHLRHWGSAPKLIKPREPIARACASMARSQSPSRWTFPHASQRNFALEGPEPEPKSFCQNPILSLLSPLIAAQPRLPTGLFTTVRPNAMRLTRGRLPPWGGRRVQPPVRPQYRDSPSSLPMCLKESLCCVDPLTALLPKR
jgi:hypothetical protein